MRIEIKKHLFNILLVLFGGAGGYSILLLLYKFADFESLKNFLFQFSCGYLLWFLFISIVEEGTKFLLIWRWTMGIFPYGFFLGLSWGLMEMFSRGFGWQAIGIAPVFLHVLTAGIICYFVKKKKPVLGLLLGITIHTIYNLIIVYSFIK